MASLNEIQIMGNVGQDPEIRDAGSNKVASFSVAVTEKYNDKETTEWFNVVCWNKQAETAVKYFKKGTSLYIKGKIQTRSWEKDGVKQYKTELLMSGFRFIGGKKQEEGEKPATSTPAPTLPDMKDDLPF